MKQPLIYLFFGLILMAQSCTKEKSNPPVYIDAEYKKYFDYKNGTYWVYYDSLTGHTDSMFIKNPTHYPP